MAHTFDPDKADRLDDVARYRYCSRDELIDLLDPPIDVLADLGSGTGFYTADMAPYAETVVGVDLQPIMHGYFQQKGLPTNTNLVTAAVRSLPFNNDALDAAFSTMTFHEFATPEALTEVSRVLREGGRFVTVDWSASGEGEAGPPLSERQDTTSAESLLQAADFEVIRTNERPETFVVVARKL